MNNTLDTLKNVLQSKGEVMVSAIQKDLNVKKSNSTSTLSKSLRFVTSIGSTSVTGTLYAEDYFVFVNEGRGPGKMPPHDPDKGITPILDWVRAKPISYTDISESSLVYLIRRKIGKEGTKGTKVFTTNTNIFANSINKDVSEHLMKGFKNDIKEQIKK
jgi:hypothetical protein